MYKITKIIIALLLIFFVSQKISASTNYVSKSGGNIPPFDSWENAATNIQDAVDAASAGNLVLVNDGTYYPGSQIDVTKDITVKSLNGAEKTIVDGENTSRCFYINAGDTIDGFTITNGYSTEGGGIHCRQGGTVLNCTVSGNSGGGIHFYLAGGIVENCLINGNSGYGVVCYSGGTVQFSTISKNADGGVFCNYGGSVQNCTITDNTGANGGGINCNQKANIKNSLIINNSATGNGGGVYMSTPVASAINITFANNTVAENSATGNGGGVYSTKPIESYNSIIYDNAASADSQINNNVATYYCCIENGDLSNSSITNNPDFYSDVNFHFIDGSPCIDAGTNLPGVFSEKDLDGNPRVLEGIVDIGCYEGPIPEPGYLIFIIYCLSFISRKFITGA